MADSNPTPAPPAGPTARTLALGGIIAILVAVAIHTSAAPAANTATNATQTVIQTVLSAGLGLVGALFWVTGALRMAVAGAGQAGPVLPELAARLDAINANVAQADSVKRVHHRHKDLELIRTTLAQDILDKQYEAALTLVRELADTYGHVEEAEEFRAKVNEARAAAYEEKAQAALEQLDTLLAAGDFDKGVPLANRISRTFPDSSKVGNIGERVKHAMEEFKKKLEAEFRHAAEHEDVDRAMELIKQIDRHFTRQEAEALVEIARSVIHRKKDNLVVRYKLALHDKEWGTAVDIGEQIIGEFPNGQAAKDVRRHMDVLRERATISEKYSTTG